MASDASEKLNLKLERKQAGEEDEATARVLRAASQLKDKAKDRGVLAYLLKPVSRERPNERFLQNTIRSVNFANRQADEKEMWERWDRLRSSRERCTTERQRTLAAGDDKSSTSDDGSGGSSGHSDEWELEEFLRQRKSRGRGAVGARSDEPGPYMRPEAGAEGGRSGASPRGEPHRRRHGPEAPQWIREAARSGGGGETSPHESGEAAEGRDGSPRQRKRRRTEHEGKARKEKRPRRDKSGKKGKHKEKGHRKKQRRSPP
mmetsp:Transcript_20055/g.47767  ORF Transcript_20055/g.47767 Transcript_20055/m.47767 type:complete len:261 (-) Transcript_20055:51-833(-)